jgi:putative ABC transport system ATP-binding protein
MIRLDSISLTFNKGLAAEVKALDRLNLEIEAGTFTLVLGANGSGKSSLLNILAGSILPDSGQINFKNQNITRWPDYKRSAFIARIFQDPLKGTAPGMSLLENFRLASLRNNTRGLQTGLNRNFRRLVAEQVSSLEMGLENRLDQLMGSFSGGQRQALSLLMATWCKADLLLMDEPTAALDPSSAATVFNLAQKIIREKGITCLMVTHDLKYCIQAGDRILLFSEGKVTRDLKGQSKKDLNYNDVANWFI